MRNDYPFTRRDLDELDEVLLDRAVQVVPMREVHAGKTHQTIVGMRHDVDNEIESSVEFARWECERGYRSTYFILHTAPYWQDKTLLRKSLEFMVECGHEIGIHNDAIAAAIDQKRDPRMILAEAVGELRDYGFDIRGTVGHGSHLCYASDGSIRFANDELFTECSRPSLGVPERSVAGVTIRPVPLRTFQLKYDSAWLGRGHYLSDSGGAWSQPFDNVAAGFPYQNQLHMLVHCCWWAQAFTSEQIAA
jgi:hypothetical protein